MQIVFYACCIVLGIFVYKVLKLSLLLYFVWLFKGIHHLRYLCCYYFDFILLVLVWYGFKELVLIYLRNILRKTGIYGQLKLSS